MKTLFKMIITAAFATVLLGCAGSHRGGSLILQ